MAGDWRKGDGGEMTTAQLATLIIFGVIGTLALMGVLAFMRDRRDVGVLDVDEARRRGL